MQFIYDVDAVERFEELFKVKIDNEDHRQITMLTTRPGYINAPTDSNGIALVKNRMFNRCVLRSCDNLLLTLRKYEIADECYQQVNRDGTTIPIPKEALVVYMNLNPFSHKQAMVKLTTDMVTCLAGGDTDKYNVESQYKTFLHKSPVQGRWLDLDVDSKDPEIVDPLVQRFCRVIHVMIESKNGYHIVIDKEKWTKDDGRELYDRFINVESNKYQKKHESGKLVDDTFISINKGSLVPIPGTLQGDFPVTFHQFLVQP